MNTKSSDTKMQTIEVTSLSFHSYSRLCVLIFVCLGVVGSALFLIIDLLVLDSTIQLGMIRLNDTETGVVVLFVGPFIAGLIGVIVSLITYQLFLGALHRFGNLSLTGTWSVVKPLGIPFPQDQAKDHTSSVKAD